MKTIDIDKEGNALKHGPWCNDTRSLPPPPKCAECNAKEK